jgi:NAD(P)-dependent dehydrogenase (short-subunit alcohol dehydrogenase family)
MSAYSGTKFAVEAITDCLRMELLPFGIRVVAIEPGPVGRTRFSNHMHEVSEAYWDRPGRYAAAYASVRRDRNKPVPGSVPAEAVARVIRRAAEATRPAARYVTQHGQSLAIRVSKAFPRRWVDRAIMKYMGFGSPGGKP